MEWVSVEDRLPDSDDEFLIVVGNTVAVCMFNPWTSDPKRNLELSYQWFFMKTFQTGEVKGVRLWA